MADFPTIPGGFGIPLVDMTTKLFPEPTMDALGDMFGRSDGRVIHRGAFTLAAVEATLDAAEAAGPYTIAYFPPGVYNVGAGLSMAGRTAQIQGAGAGGYDAAWSGTTFYAASQTGPVINFTDFVVPVDNGGELFTSRVAFGNFAVVGSGAADATKARSGVRLEKMSSAYFHDITVRGTGGPGWEHVESPGDAVYLCDFERITVHTPVSAQTNDVPYFIFNESNGCRFRSLGIRSTTTTNDCGVSGAIVVKGNATHNGYDTLFDGTWIEYIHVPTSGCVINLSANKSHFRDTGWHDAFKISGATNTAHFRLSNAATQDWGGNTISGFIPGNGGGGTEIDWGVDVLQSRNRIEGVKGYTGQNVRIASGVGFTVVDLGGGESSAASAAVQNNSTEITNIIRDDYVRTYREGTWARINKEAGEGGAGPRITDAATPANGAVWLGNADARVQAVGANMYQSADQFHFRTIGFGPAQLFVNGVSGPVITSHTGDPNGAAIYAHPGSLCICTDGTMWRKATGAGTNTGWVSLS